MMHHPTELQTPTKPFDIGFADTQFALDTNKALPDCPYSSGTSDSTEWWAGRQAAIDNDALEREAVNNSVGLKLLEALIETLVYKFGTLLILLTSMSVWIIYNTEMSTWVEILTLYFVADSSLRLTLKFIEQYNAKG